MKFNQIAPALLLAAIPLFAADDSRSVIMDFESDNPNHVEEEFFTGKKSYKFAGTGKYSYRKFPLKLENGQSYKLTFSMRKDVCTPADAKKIDLGICSYIPGTRKFRTYVIAGGNIPGEGKWETQSKTFKVPADGGDCALMLYNRTGVNFYIDDIKIEPLGEAKPGSGTATAAAAAGTASEQVVRPLPPITDEEAAKEEKDWLVNRRGIEALDDDFILPPFSPIAFKNYTASVWGRDYKFGKTGLLDDVKILGEDFLAGAMTFSAKVNGKAVKFTPEVQAVLRQKKGIVEIFSRASSPDVDIEVRTAVEYDGMIKVDFSIDPRGTVQVDEFKYNIPFPEKFAQFIHYTGARDGGYSLNIPRLSNTRRLPAGQGKIWEDPFKILVWLGSYDRGLLWFCESEQNWSPHDRKARKEGLTVIRENGKVNLQVTPVSEPRLFSKKTTYTFGLMATPVRPRTPGWRNTDMDYEYNAATAFRKYGANFPVIYSSGSYDFTPPATTNPAAASFYPRIYNDAAYKGRTDDAHSKGRLFGIYIDPILFSLGIYKDMSLYKAKLWDPTTDNADTGEEIKSRFLWQSYETKKYFEEWRKEPLATAPYSRHKGERQYQVGMGSRYQDFFCFLLEKHAALGCDGVANLDEWGPVPDANARHDMGYYDRDGKRYPEYDWFGRRDMLKRMCAVFYKKHGKLPIMRVHLAATLVVPIASFCDSVVTGENVNSAYFNGSSLMDKYTVNAKEITESLKNGGKDFLYYASDPDRWAIEYGGQAFGWNVCVMSNLTKSPQLDSTYAKSPEAARDYLAMCLTHDNTLWPVFCNPNDAYKVVKIKQDFGIGDKDVKFYAYWGDEHPVTVDGKECYAVAWQNGSKFLVCVSNLSLENQDLTVTLDKAFFSGNVKILDAESNEEVKLNGGKFKVNIPRRNYKLYLVSK